MLDTMYELPSLEGVQEVAISKQVVEGTAPPLYIETTQTVRIVPVMRGPESVSAGRPRLRRGRPRSRAGVVGECKAKLRKITALSPRRQLHIPGGDRWCATDWPRR